MKLRRKLCVFLIIAICFLLQTTLFQALSFASISPNLLVAVTSSFGFMRGRKEGMWIGFFCGLLLDIFFGSVIGFYALIYAYIGYVKLICVLSSRNSLLSETSTRVIKSPS